MTGEATRMSQLAAAASLLDWHHRTFSLLREQEKPSLEVGFVAGTWEAFPRPETRQLPAVVTAQHWELKHGVNNANGADWEASL